MRKIDDDQENNVELRSNEVLVAMTDNEFLLLGSLGAAWRYAPGSKNNPSFWWASDAMEPALRAVGAWAEAKCRINGLRHVLGVLDKLMGVGDGNE